MIFFFYGTLMANEILEAVLRRQVDPARRRRARLVGYRRVYRRGAFHPVLVSDSASEVDGIVVWGLTTRDIAMLKAYEGPAYEITELTVLLYAGRTAKAKVFLPATTCQPSSVAWTFEDWRRRFGARNRRDPLVARFANGGRGRRATRP